MVKRCWGWITLLEKNFIFILFWQTPNTQHLLILNKRTTINNHPQVYGGKKIYYNTIMNRGNPNPVINPKDPNAQIEQTIQGYAQQPPPLPEPPQTFVIECNKVEAVKDYTSYNLDETTGIQTGSPNIWTNNFPAIKLKKGDMISVNSAFLSSRGGGDLLQFDTTNNKTRILFEYYATNDKTNGKRSLLDIKGTEQSKGKISPYKLNFTLDGKDNKTVNPTGCYMCYPANYRPMKLYRLMETFKDSSDFHGAPASNTIALLNNTYPPDTSPYYSEIERPNWGYQVASEYIVENAEDKYVPGLFRNPQLNLRENMFFQDYSDPDPANESFVGQQLDGLAIWYVSNQTSIYGTCNLDATMRIYFAWGKRNQGDPNAPKVVDCGQAAREFMGKLRPGETIQWLNTENWCSFGTPERPQCNGVIINQAAGFQIRGPNVYTLKGPARYGLGVPGFLYEHDRFIQIGRPGGTGTAAQTGNDYQNPMGMFQKIVRINMGVRTNAQANIGSPAWRNQNNDTPTGYVASDLIEEGKATSNDFLDYPWIEVLCARSTSFCYGDPNNWHLYGGHPNDPGNRLRAYNPWPGPMIRESGLFTDTGMLSPEDSLACRTWTIKGQQRGVITPGPSFEDHQTFADYGLVGSWDNKAVAPEIGIKDRTQHYVCYKPYYNSPLTRNTEGYARTSIFAPHNENDIANSSAQFNIDIGATGMNPANTLSAYNYNILTQGHKDTTIAFLKYGWDIPGDEDNATGYAGGRTPSSWMPEANLFTSNNYSTITRKGVYNQGNYYWASMVAKEMYQVNGSVPHPHNGPNDRGQGIEPGVAPFGPNGSPGKSSTWMSVLNEATDNELRTGGTWTHNPNDKDIYYGKNVEQYDSMTLLRGAGRSMTYRNKLETNVVPGNSTYNKNEKDMPIKCYFSWSIIGDSSVEYDGSQPHDYGVTGGTVSFPSGTLPAEGRQFSKLDWLTDDQQKAGVKNYICQVQNLPQALYQKDLTYEGGINPEGEWLPTVANPNGMFYGYDQDASCGLAIGYPHGNIADDRYGPWGQRTTYQGIPPRDRQFIQRGYYRQPSGGSNEKTCCDLPNVFSQLPGEFYAKFTNPVTKETEIMYIKTFCHNTIYSASLDTSGRANGFTPDETFSTPAAYNPCFTHADISLNGDYTGAVQIPAQLPGGAAAPTDTNDINKSYSRPVSFVILQRNCGGTGPKAFNGVLPIGPGGDNTGPLTTDPYRQNTITDNMSYFEILNGFANMESSYSVDGSQIDLQNFTPNYFFENNQYLLNFGQGRPDTGEPGEGNKPRYGLPTGGDFYITPIPNQPLGVDYSSLLSRLSTELIKFGEPTTSSKSDIDNHSPAHTGKYSFLEHYDYIDVELNPDIMYSPTDIANLVTEQLHKPSDLYYSYNGAPGGGRQPGGQVPNTANKFKLNSLFRQIHGPTDGATEVSGSGWLAGQYTPGEFVYMADVNKRQIRNSINAFAWKQNGGLQGDFTGKDILPTSGQYPVFIGNGNTNVNVAPTTNQFQIPGFCSGQKGQDPSVLWTDFDYMNNPDDTGSHTDKNIVISGEYAGASNAQLNFNTDISKFEWKFLHQPVFSDFKIDNDTGQTTGGKVVARQWAGAIDGVDNWDRHGGVNIINWFSPRNVFGGVSIRRQFSNKFDPLTGTDSVGKNFLNKLGFTTYWCYTNSGEAPDGYKDTNTAEYDLQKDYFPLGTTRSDIDVSETRPYTQVNSYLNPLLPRVNVSAEAIGEITVAKAPFMWNYDSKNKSMISGLTRDNFNYKTAFGQAVGPILDPTTGAAKKPPYNLGYQDGAKLADDNPTAAAQVIQFGNSQGYSNNICQNTPASVEYMDSVTAGQQTGKTGEMLPTKLNLDDVKHPYMEVETDSIGLRATELPKKTNIGYFLILSDLIDKHEFMGSANGGGPQKCLGILSKNYENNDFFFSFQSPVQFYVKQDRVITSVRTEIVTPSLTQPVGLDFNSSIIYTIVRSQTEPEADVAPMGLTQAYDYALMEQMNNQLGIDMTEINGALIPSMLPNSQNVGIPVLNDLRMNLVNAVLQPNDQQAAILSRTQSEISDNLSRMSLRERMQLLGGMGLDIDPNAVGLPPGLGAGLQGGMNLQQTNEPVVAAAEHASGYGMSAQATLDAMDQTRQAPAQNVAEESVATNPRMNRAMRDVVAQGRDLQTGQGGRGRRGAGIPDIPTRIQDPGTRDIMENIRGMAPQREGSTETHTGALKRAKSTGSLASKTTASSAPSSNFPGYAHPTAEQTEGRRRMEALNLEGRTGGTAERAQQSGAIGRQVSGSKN